MTTEDAPEDPRHADERPHNYDAEQAILAALLFDNANFEHLPDTLLGDHFYDPLNGSMFSVLQEFISTGRVADELTIHERFHRVAAYEEIGGMRYLADLVDIAPPSSVLKDYAILIHDLALRRELMSAGADLMSAAQGDRETPALQMIDEIEQRLFSLATAKTKKGLTDFHTVMENVLDEAATAYDSDGSFSGLSTGMADLDAKLKGIHPANLIFIAGRPGSGKTSLAANIGYNLAKAFTAEINDRGEAVPKAGGRVAMFSLEMSEEELGRRLLADESEISSSRIKSGEMTFDEFGRVRDAALQIANIPLKIDAQGGNTLAAISTRARRMKRTTGLDLIIVDYLQIMGGDARQRHEVVAQNSRGLKALAKDLDVPVIALSQVSRDVDKRDDKRPALADLRESGSIEEDADVVIFLYREAYYLEKEAPKEGTSEFLEWEDAMDKCRNVGEAIIAKNRHGALGRVKLAFNPDLTKFSDLVKPGFN